MPQESPLHAGISISSPCAEMGRAQTCDNLAIRYELYRPYGFQALGIPDKYMEIARPDIYAAPREALSGS